jgi:hypothetical protein
MRFQVKQKQDRYLTGFMTTADYFDLLNMLNYAKALQLFAQQTDF